MRYNSEFFSRHDWHNSTIIQRIPLKTNIQVQQFIEHESRNLRTIRNIILCLLLFVDVLLLSFLVYAFHSVYQARGLQGDFFSYSFHIILSIQSLLLLVLAPLMWMIHRRFQLILVEINDLNEEFALLYEEYCYRVRSLFLSPPQYLISQKGLLVFKNLKRIVFPSHSIQKIVIRRINLGRFGKKCKVRIYQHQRPVISFTYGTLYPEEVEFLKRHIVFMNQSLVLEDEV